MGKDKILIIDDEEIIGESIVDSLNHENYEIVSADNGKKGLDLLKRRILY